MLRDIAPGDFEKIQEIHDRCHKFPVPRLTNVVDDSIICDNEGKVIGYGLVKLFPELIMVLDTSVPVRIRINALNEFLERSILAAKAADASQIHAFVEDKRLTEFLIERYGFQTISDNPLVLNLE